MRDDSLVRGVTQPLDGKHEMATDRICVRISPSLRRKLQQQASASGKRESDVVREALEQYLAARRVQETCYDVALRSGVIGVVKDAPAALSTNRKYFKGLGAE